MRGTNPVEEGASFHRTEDLIHATDTCLVWGMSWNWDCQRLLNRQLCNKSKETLKCPWAWVGRDTCVTERPTFQSEGS